MDSDVVEFLYSRAAASEAASACAVVLASAPLFVIWVLAAAAVAWGDANRRNQAILASSAILGALIALGANALVHVFYYRPRPFVAMGVEPLIGHSREASFFSDHLTVAGAAVAIALLGVRRIGLITAGLAFLMAVGRLAVGVHYPSDVVVGFIVGGLASISLRWLWLRATSRQPHSLPSPRVYRSGGGH